MKTVLLLLSCIFFALPLRAQSLLSIEQKLQRPLNLQQFGGSDIDIVIRAVDAGNISVEIRDKTKMVAAVKTNINEVQAYPEYAQVYYNNKTTYAPTTTTKLVAKSNGIPVSGTLQKLYLLYEDPKNQVYYQDSIATAADACRLRILEKPK